MPVLAGVYLRATAPDRLYLAATDMDMGISLTVKGEVNSEGAVVLPARILSEAIRRIPPGRINLTVDPSTFVGTITWGTRSTFSIPGIEPEQFPALPEPREEWGISLGAEECRNMVRQTVFAAAQSETRPILSGVLVKLEPDELTMVAVDYARMALSKTTLGQEQPGAKHRAVIPARTLTEIARVLGGTGGERVQVGFSHSHAFFGIGEMTVLSRLLEGQFPAYEQFIPTAFVTRVTVDAAALAESCERAALVCTDEDRTVRMKVGDQCLTVQAWTPDVGMVYEEVPAHTEGDAMEVALNVRYVQDVLRNVSSEQVTLQFTGRFSAAAITQEGSDNFICIIMPIRTHDQEQSEEQDVME